MANKNPKKAFVAQI